MSKVNVWDLEQFVPGKIAGFRFLRTAIASVMAYGLQLLVEVLPETAETVLLVAVILAVDKYLRAKGIY